MATRGPPKTCVEDESRQRQSQDRTTNALDLPARDIQRRESLSRPRRSDDFGRHPAAPMNDRRREESRFGDYEAFGQGQLDSEDQPRFRTLASSSATIRRSSPSTQIVQDPQNVYAARSYTRPTSSRHQRASPPRYESTRRLERELQKMTVSSPSSSQEDINILLVGPTGLGKTTFINALYHYIAYDSLERATAGPMLALIPSSFTFFTDEGDSRTIRIGREDRYEQFNQVGQSSTQECRAFVFQIGQRKLRLIDTPGLGDTRGIEHDARNLQEIFTTIAQYRYLSGICIILKPNEQRLLINFEYCVNEILRHLPISARNNLNFVFTHARETFYRPGNTRKLLEVLLEKHFVEQEAKIPLSMDNTFLLENGSFRYLALLNEGITLSDLETQSYQQGWSHSVQICEKFLAHVVGSPLHHVQGMISLNDAEQLIRKLPRPLAEIQRQIAENLERAGIFKQEVLKNPQAINDGIPQAEGRTRELDHPQTVSILKSNPRQTGKVDGRTIQIQSTCHDRCAVKGVTQEFIGDANLDRCEVMDPKTGICQKCGRSWKFHMHITYEYISDTTRVMSARRRSTVDDPTKLTLGDIDDRITNLRREGKQIEDVYKQLVHYLQANSLLLFDDAFVKYLDYFIEEEKAKKTPSRDTANVIDNLQRLRAEFEEHTRRFKSVLQLIPETDRHKQCPLTAEDIVRLVNTLYDLPINGRSIRAQVNIIGMAQAKVNSEKERQVPLPEEARCSKVMTTLIRLLS